MIIKLNINQFEYLDDSVFKSKESLRFKLHVKKEGNFAFIEIDEDVADEIRDWASEELQKRGFDKNYQLTPEGKILEELIDSFYIE